MMSLHQNPDWSVLCRPCEQSIWDRNGTPGCSCFRFENFKSDIGLEPPTAADNVSTWLSGQNGSLVKTQCAECDADR